MGWLMTASGVLASDVCLCATARPAGPAKQATTASRAILPRSAQLRDVELSATRSADGIPIVRFARHGLEFLKTVQPDGRFQLEIQFTDDKVVVTGVADTIAFERLGRVVFVNMKATEDGSLDQARTLLADSKALRQFRMLAYGLSPSEAASPAGTAVQLTAAYFSVLDGDIGAAERFSTRRNRPSGAPSLRPSGALEGEEELDGGPSCYKRFEAEVVAAMNDYELCLWEVRWLPGLSDLCGYVWALRAEAAWFEFLKCVGIRIT